MQNTTTNQSEEFYGEFGKTFEFTLDDLETNRAGKLSERQARKQGLRLGMAMGMLIFLPSFLAFIVIVFSIFSLVSYFTTGNTGLLLPQNCYVIFLATPAIVLWFYNRSGLREFQADAKQENVKRLDYPRFRELTAKRKPFSMTPEQESLLQSHSNLQLYVLPSSNIIVSLEEISPES